MTLPGDQERSKEAYEKGRREGEKAGVVEEVIHNLGDLIPAGTPEEAARDRGFHDAKGWK
jgi:hypothetical protein